MEQQRFTVTAEGLGRLEVLNRISVLYIQRHIPVEQMHFQPIDAKASRFVVCAFTTEDTIRRVVGQMNNIIEINNVTYSRCD